MRSFFEYAGHALPWQSQIPIFLCIFVAVGTFCSIPSETFPNGFTVNQALEDFGVFVLFMALWIGIYAHWRRDINFSWLLLIFAVALIQEEFNIWNRLLFWACDLVGVEMTSKERQRGDVYMLALVAVSLFLRMMVQRQFKSFLRIHITFFLFIFTAFQLLIHFVFAYHLQTKVIEQRQKYIQEVAATHTDRFDYLCQAEGFQCFEFAGRPGEDAVAAAPTVVEVISNSSTDQLFVTAWLDVIKPSDEIFRGVDANKKILAALLYDQGHSRLVVDKQFPLALHDTISSTLLIFATPFGLVWFFGGMHLVLFHQARVYRIKYGARYRQAAA